MPKPLAPRPTRRPSRKMSATALAGAIVAVGGYVLEATAHVHPPIAIVSAATTIVTFACGYLTTDDQG